MLFNKSGNLQRPVLLLGNDWFPYFLLQRTFQVQLVIITFPYVTHATPWILLVPLYINWEVLLRMSEGESCSVVSDSLWPHGLYSPCNSPSQNTGVGSLSLLQGIFPTQGSNPGLPHCSQILYQLTHKGSPRVLEWIAYPFSIGSSRPMN